MEKYQLTFDKKDFINTIWQKKPVILRQAFTDFIDPISAEEIAGLACAEEVASRVVITKERDWDIFHGPFKDYSQYGESNWQLLVQAVNHWYPDSQGLVEAFRFLPDWRFDDLMASFATPNGGVGPHIDQYDVFIIQGQGRRRWKVGDIGDYQNRDNNPNTPLINDFEPIIDDILETGDILYIPPGFPHRGETLTETALSYSIGFRAPNQQEFFNDIADLIGDLDLGQQRFTSNNEPAAPGIIPAEQQQGLMTLLTDLANNPAQYQQLLGILLSQNRFELDICEVEAISTTELMNAINDGLALKRIGGLKVLRLENDPICRLFVNGEEFQLSEAARTHAEYISNHTTLTADKLTHMLAENETDLAPLMHSFIEKGYFYFDEA